MSLYEHMENLEELVKGVFTTLEWSSYAISWSILPLLGVSLIHDYRNRKSSYRNK